MNLAEVLAMEDPVRIARLLIGLELVTEIGGRLTSGLITETEAYWAPEDRASHAYNHRRTKRTEVFYGPAGTSYVYLCYGIHELFNVITGPEGTPHAVLIRAVSPLRGLDTIMERRAIKTLKPQLTSGPGVVSRALGITRRHNGLNLLDDQSPVRLKVTRTRVAASQIGESPRIGIDYAGPPWADKHWRFFLKDSPFVSRSPGKKQSAPNS
ncbi:DNA-3-methyladenine glycosylase [Lewinella sp. W8]|uniref:DNA-3-methyladenine glycosylase n=1 Tax=Lewinella sp. W8 TaxID=2528208 RepID=UPI00106832A6|nr:DNA-3-methyladenine glycosylase [Lewinella sp. W8]MTB49573.1 DNA-3-methyladenine glycosylase [Lewinella sp. W8]